MRGGAISSGGATPRAWPAEASIRCNAVIAVIAVIAVTSSGLWSHAHTHVPASHNCGGG